LAAVYALYRATGSARHAWGRWGAARQPAI